MKTPFRLKAALAITFALCFITAFVLADDRRLKFGGGGGASSLMLDTNLFYTPGTTTSNAAVSATIWTYVTPTANPTSNGSPAALASIVIPSVMLQNTGDTITLYAFGVMPSAQANTNQFKIVFGSTTNLDTGLQTASNTTYTIDASFTRCDTNILNVRAVCSWGPGGGVPFAFTNVSQIIGETNTVDTTLSFLSTGLRQGSHTNLLFSIGWKPNGK